MTYAQYNKQGDIISYCNRELIDSIEIPQNIYSDNMHEQYCVVNREFVLKDDAPQTINNSVADDDVEVDLQRLKNDLRTRTSRGVNIEYIHRLKEKEAIEFLDSVNVDVHPITDDYPFIQNESEIRGITPIECANLFKQKADEERNRLVAIEMKRQQSKIDINNATTVEEAETAYIV